jgi:hypothetical protein
MKTRTNRDILLKYFWEHAEFAWRTQEFMVNRFEFFHHWRQLVSTMTRTAIGKIRDPQERLQVQAFLEQRYGADLIPSANRLQFPSDPMVGDAAAWQPAFDHLRTLYGPIAVSLRLGKDLRKYKPHESLLRDAIEFVRLDEFRFGSVRTGHDNEFTVHVQEFPREHLYRVESNGATILGFDDWPSKWSREWTKESMR